MFLFLSQVMDYRLNAVLSNCLHHNYLLKKACRVSINVNFVTVKGECRVPVSWRETVTQSAIESPAVLLLRPHRDEVWIFHNRSFEGLQELLVWLNIQWTATHILTRWNRMKGCIVDETWAAPWRTGQNSLLADSPGQIFWNQINYSAMDLKHL